MSINKLNALRCAIKSSVNLRLRPNLLNFRPNYRTIATDGKIIIDGITKELIKPNNPLFVPQKFRKFYRKFIDCGTNNAIEIDL